METQVWGKEGESGQYHGIKKGTQRARLYIEMQDLPPSQEYIAQAGGTWVLSEEKMKEAKALEYAATTDPVACELVRLTTLGASEEELAEVQQKMIEKDEAIQDKYSN